jgi:hypothetical protein
MGRERLRKLCKTLALLAACVFIVRVNDMSARSAVEVFYRDGISPPHRITQDEENVYWLHGPVMDAAGQNAGYEILAASKKTGTVRVVGKSSSIDLVLLESGGYIYKLDRSRITRYRSSGGDEEVVFEKPNYFEPMMAVSPSGLVYWFTQPESGGLLQAMSIKDRKVTTLTSGEKTSNFGHAIADDNNVYWIEPQTGTLKAVSAQTGKLRVMFSGCADVEALAADEKYVYFTGPQGIMRASKAAPLKVDLIGRLSTRVSDLAVDDYSIYYASWFSQPNMSNGRIGKIPKSGGAARDVATSLTTPTSMLVDRDHVYFTDDAGNKPGGNRTINRIAH